jgi:hypothetical protein
MASAAPPALKAASTGLPSTVLSWKYSWRVGGRQGGVRLRFEPGLRQRLRQRPCSQRGLVQQQTASSGSNGGERRAAAVAHHPLPLLAHRRHPVYPKCGAGAPEGRGEDQGHLRPAHAGCALAPAPPAPQGPASTEPAKRATCSPAPSLANIRRPQDQHAAGRAVGARRAEEGCWGASTGRTPCPGCQSPRS